MVEAGGRVEAYEGHGRSYFGRGKGVASKGIWQAWRELGGVGGGGARTEKVGGKAGKIGILGQRQMTPMWEDDPM